MVALTQLDDGQTDHDPIAFNSEPRRLAIEYALANLLSF
jgi:hypothetical protein